MIPVSVGILGAISKELRKKLGGLKKARPQKDDEMGWNTVESAGVMGIFSVKFHIKSLGTLKYKQITHFRLEDYALFFNYQDEKNLSSDGYSPFSRL